MTTIDGRQIGVERAGPTQPDSEINYPELGMPKTKGGRGDMIVQVKVKFPSNLTIQQKNGLREIL